MKKLLYRSAKSLTFCVILVASIASFGQKVSQKKADEDFNKHAFINASRVYEKIANKGYVNTSILTRLGDSYYFNGKLPEAYKWYDLLFEGVYEDKNVNDISSEYYYRYAQTLRAVDKYAQSEKVLDLFVQKEANDTRARLYEEQKDDYILNIKENSGKYELFSIPINSPFSDYGGIMRGQHLIFTSARPSNGSKKIHQWTNEHFTSFFQSEVSSDWLFELPTEFAHKLDPSTVNVATPAFTMDGKTMYFTKNNSRPDGKGKFNKEDVSTLKIYRANLDTNGQWENIIELPFNSDNFNTAHPAISPDGKWLYFSSNREGTYGSSDLYRVQIMEFGQFGDPENLGARINTEARESFPFISSDNVLYFSSDGRPGLGGLDVFKVSIYQDNTFSSVEAVGAPINSPFDDFALYLTDDLKRGFISSNRPGGDGGDDIYSLKQVVLSQDLGGVILDKHTNELVRGSVVTLMDNEFNVLRTVVPDNMGKFDVNDLLCGAKYRIKIEAEGYLTLEVPYVVDYSQDRKSKTFTLEGIETTVELEDDLFDKLSLKPIYFDFDRSYIRPDAKIELIKIVEVMKEVPSMRIAIRSHTDNRGAKKYNQTLSDQRAASTASWIISQGISPTRITYEGVGSKEPVVNCKQCTEEQYQENRRSEFIIKDL